MILFISEKRRLEERKEICYIELEGENKFSTYSFYYFPFIGFIGNMVIHLK